MAAPIYVEADLQAIKSNVFELIETLSLAFVTRLYRHPPTCLGLFKLLPTLSKMIVSRILLIPDGLPLETVESWFHDHAQNAYLKARKRLETLKVAIVAENRMMLRQEFRENLWFAFTGGGPPWVFGKPVATAAASAPRTDGAETPAEGGESGKEPVTRDSLEKYCHDQWEAVLHYMCRTDGSSQIQWTKDPPKGVLRLLESSGLMAKAVKGEHQNGNAMDTDDDDRGKGSGERLRITSKGFQFLLQDVNTQIWAFLLQYVDLADELQMDQVEMIQMLFLLGSMQEGIGYSTEAALTVTQQCMLVDLRNLGIVYQRKKKSTTFYPTPLATTLTSGAMVATRQEEVGFIMLETNYRLYAYTQSPLQIAVLALFVDLKARFKNMLVGMITRESMRDAFAHGITAQQIIQYLNTHAHPIQKKENPVLPPTVLDQLRLWELERNRLTVRHGYLYNNFVSDRDFEETARYAEMVGGLVAKRESRNNLAEKALFIKEEMHADVREYVKRRKAQGA
ncbi:transcription factor Tfb2-domain-containing protein [Hyaloraphidium curvatum]|nr:transcription factor Tfb2-domain-containing protein [Hyaloraphidium curvatum]